MEVPLLAVAPGGGSCSTDADCAPHGTCERGECECRGSADANWTGPWCRSQAAGTSNACWDVERRARREAAGAAAKQASGIVPPLECAAPSYNASHQRLLIEALCLSNPALPACIEVAWDGLWGDCSAFARASLVVRAHFIASGESECCDTLRFGRDGWRRRHVGPYLRASSTRCGVCLSWKFSYEKE